VWPTVVVSLLAAADYALMFRRAMLTGP
jgi:hypothetical protein